MFVLMTEKGKILLEAKHVHNGDQIESEAMGKDINKVIDGM